MKYLAIKNWEKYQNGEDEKVGARTWCRLHGSILDDRTFNSWPAAQQLTFVKLLALRARVGRNLDNDITWVVRQLNAERNMVSHTRRAICVLIKLGTLIPTNQQLGFTEESREEREEERGVDRETSTPSLKTGKTESEDELSLKSQLEDVLISEGFTPEISGSMRDPNIKRLNQFAKNLGGIDRVLEACTVWCRTRNNKDSQYPIRDFAKVAAEFIRSTPNSTSTGTQKLREFLDRSYAISSGDVVFSSQQQNLLALQLEEATIDELVAAFREFHTREVVDAFTRQRAARDFTDKASEYVRIVRKQAQEIAQYQGVMERQSALITAETERTLAALEQAAREEEAAIELELPEQV